jgi:hypothetical protein
MHSVEVVSIQSSGEKNTYDLNVPLTENFFLANGVLTHNSSRKPLQDKFHRLLDRRESPKAQPVIALRPTFFGRMDGGVPPKDNHWYSINPLQLTQEDFFTLMNVHKMTPAQQTMMSLVFVRVRELWRGREESFDMASFCDVIDSMDDFTDQQKHYVKVRFQPLLDSGFYRPEFQRDLVGMLREGFIPTINMENFDSFSRQSSMNLPHAFLSICVRQVIFARRKKLIPPVFIMLDEASRFVPADSNPSCKHTVTESVDLDTRFGVNWCLSGDTLISTFRGDVFLRDLDSSFDVVFAYDFVSGEVVVRSFVKSLPLVKRLFRVTLSDGRVVVASAEHRFFSFVGGLVSEVYVRDLKIGDSILAYEEMLNSVEIVSIEDVGEQECFDIGVPPEENFFLSNGILSHNCFATQQLNKTPPQIMSQCKYVFLPHNADVSDISFVLKEFGFSKIQTANNDASRLKQRMGRFEWLVFDKNRMRYDVLLPVAPLSWHQETTN